MSTDLVVGCCPPTRTGVNDPETINPRPIIRLVQTRMPRTASKLPNAFVLFYLIFALCVWVFFSLHVYLCIICVPNAHVSQKRLLYPLELELPRGCQILNLGPLEDQLMLLTPEPSFSVPIPLLSSLLPCLGPQPE